MARVTSHAGATLTVTLREELTINSKDYGSKQSFYIASIINSTRRIISIPYTADTSILSFSTAAAGGTYIVDNCQYMRFTNLDSANYLSLTFINSDDDEFVIKLDAGRSLILAGDAATDGTGGFKSIIDGGSQSLSFNITCSSSSDPTVTCSSTDKIHPGLNVSGTNVPANAYVASVNTAGAVTSFELSSATTGTISSASLTFTPRIVDLKTVKALANTAAVDMEYFIAETA